ncbi:MAG: PaaI family thioesterase [Alphaproteobacteria bacterium]|nr:PaaI family thioesterase [Alphaproteobacteria bacterium]
MNPPLPPGYRQTELVDPFEIYIGPVYEIGEGLARRYALPVDARHVNMGGRIHGGALMTFADLSLGQAVWDATGRAAVATMNMQTQFLKAVEVGEVVEVAPQITRRTRALVFARGDFTVNGELVFTAQSVWKLLGQN